MNRCFKKAVGYHTYLLVDTIAEYDRLFSNYIAKMAKRLPAQMKPHTFHPFGLMSIIGLLKNFELAWDTNEVHKDATRWLSNFFMNKTASIVLGARLSAERTEKKNSRPASGKTRFFSTYPQAVDF